MAPNGAKSSRRALRTLARRLLRAAAVVVVTGYVVYVVTLNVFLATSLFDLVVNRDPVTLDVHYTRGWTLFPGTIHARNLSIRASDSNVEWILRLDEVEFDVSFLGLARRRFDVTRARGRGIRMRVRQKLAVPPVDLADVAHLPPIDGYPAYSMRPAGPPSLERWFDEHYALWTVRLADVVAEDVREVWVDEGRFEGRARVSGGFYLKPIREVVVGPAHVEAQPGSRVTLGRSTPIATDVGGRVDLFIARFDPRAVVGDDVLRYVSGNVALQGRFADPATWPLALPVHVSGVVDARQIRLEVERGVLRPGTRVELATPRATIAKGDVIGHAPFELIAEVIPRAGEDPELRANLVLPDVSVVTVDGTEIGRVRRVVVGADARALDLARDPFADLHLAIDAFDGRVPDASHLARYLPRDARVCVLGGAAHARAHADVFRADKRASGELAIVGGALELASGRTRVRGALDGRLEVGSYRFGAHAAESVSFTGSLSKVDVWFGDDMRPNLAVGRLHLAARSRRVDFRSPFRAVDAKLTLEDVVLPDVRSLQFLVPARGGLRFVSGRARAFGVVAVSSSSKTAKGALEIDVDHGAIGIHETELAGDFVVRAQLRGFDPDARAIDLSGSTVTMRNVQVRGAAAETTRWSGEIALDETSLRLGGAAGEPPRFDGLLRMAADDARPLLGLLLRDSLPKLVVGLVTMPRLRARARMHVSPNLVLLSDVSARGGDTAVRGSYGLYGNERRGAFVVEKGPLSVGIDLERDGASPHFFNLGAWLGAHERTSRAKAAAALGGDVGSCRSKGEGATRQAR